MDTRGRDILIAPGEAGDRLLTVGNGSPGIIELVAKAFQRYSYQRMNYKAELEKRDVMELPIYHHRDDMLKETFLYC